MKREEVCELTRTFRSEYYELPNNYNDTTIKLLVQSPTRIFAYWDISTKQIKMFKKNSGRRFDDCIPYLRITNITHGYSYDFKIDPFSNNYYIEITDNDCDYKLELLRKFSNESFIVASSNKAHIPRSSPCDYNEDIVFRNCVCLSITDKFKLYTQNRSNLKKYTDLSFGSDSVESSMNNFNR